MQRTGGKEVKKILRRVYACAVSNSPSVLSSVNRRIKGGCDHGSEGEKFTAGKAKEN